MQNSLKGNIENAIKAYFKDRKVDVTITEHILELGPDKNFSIKITVMVNER